MKKIRIGSGAGYAGDRIEPALDLIKRGNLDYIIFECLAERTIAMAQREKRQDKTKGYNYLLEYRMRQVLPLAAKHKVKIITNMGAANPEAAARITKALGEEQGIYNLKIAYVVGDDISSNLQNYLQEKTIETGRTLMEIDRELISANAYIGAGSIVEALQMGADIVITGRASDPSLTVGPLLHEFEKPFTDEYFLANATVAGHLLECGAQVTGGYFADPGFKDVPELWNVGFPIVEFSETGDMTVEKLSATGGILSEETIKEQLVYEIHDPKQYLTPDVIVDFSQIVVENEEDRVKISGISGNKKTGTLKVSVGYEDGFIAEGEISYGGSNSLALAELAAEVVNKRLGIIGLDYEEIRIDYIGLNSLYGRSVSDKHIFPEEIRLRIAIRTKGIESANKFCKEIESLYTNGPSGGGGIRTYIKEIMAIESILVDEKQIPTSYEFV
ncbi:acyclic terpene utilization AtuA family protein [uncultured Trichococcus sp.]|uniref:acyclic terpene utilization AtuA family protein n=1 Tax=uncultured Trichococcus sp. TaxID=189665 RepID=UPI002A18E35E|nr:acyclic terpene utilization AtuA family protein [uncultured Trichococcus sp.]